jgi:putative phosphoesterase
MSRIARIGIISDTHGVVHPAVAQVFADVDAIVHAGDIGGEHVLDALRALAPLTAVDGNNDDASGEEIARLNVGALRLLVTHILPRPHKPDARVLASLREEPADTVVFGHSHLPHNELLDGVRYFNPASAGPRRFDYPVSVGLFEKKGREWTAVHVALDERSVDALKKRMNQLSR